MSKSRYASINIAGMTSLVKSAEGVNKQMPFDAYGFRTILVNVDLDDTPAAGVGKVQAWLEQQIPSLKRRLALAQANEAQGHSFKGVVTIDETQVSTVDPTTAQNQGAAAAKTLKDADGKVDPKVIAMIAKYQNDPYFAAGLAKNLTPAQLANIVQRASDNYRYSEAGGSPKTPEFKNYHALMTALGTTMGTATRNTGDLALPAGTAQTWVKFITRSPSGDDDYTPGQAAALTTLMRHGVFSTSFLHTVSDGVYNYERSQGGKAVWGPRGYGDDAILDPDKPLATSVDAMGNILYALGHNPAAAQQFFDVGNPNASTKTVKINGHEVKVNARLEYLITERTFDTSKGADDGTGLGRALTAATTFYRNGDHTGQISATIASQALALVGNKIGDGAHGGHIYELGMGASDGWQVPPGMRTSLATILSSYGPDLLRVASSGSDDFTQGWTQKSGQFFPPNGPLGASLDKDLLAKLLGTLGQDQKNIDIVTTGVGAAGQLRMRYALAQALKGDPNAAKILLQGGNVPGVVGASNEIASALGFVINSAYKGDADDQAFQKKQAEALSKAMGIVLAAPSFAVPEGAPWTGYLLDQVKDAALDKIGEGPDQDAQGTYNVVASTSSVNLQRAILNDVLASGYLSKANYDKANGSGHLYQPPPAGALATGQDGKPLDPPQFDFDSPAYKDWARGGQNLRSFLNTNILVPFHDQFPALGTGGDGG